MKSKLIRNDIPLYSPEWYDYRSNFVNASEVGNILGLSQYSCAARVFSEKIGTIEQFKEDNKFTYWGKEMEDLIGKAWQYYDGTEDSYIRNSKENKIIRKCKNINGYVSNPDYPWLSMSLDRVINRGQFNLIDRSALKEECPLEIKRIHAMELKKWEAVPPAYLAQITTQMIIMEADYSEMVLLDSDNNLHVYPIEYNESLAKTIIESTKEFWYARVMPAKEMIKLATDLPDGEEKGILMDQVNSLEPPADSSEAYEQFLKEKYRDSAIIGTKEGSAQDWENCVDYNKLNKQIAEIETEKQHYKNQILSSIGTLEKISFGEDGHVTYSKDKNNKRALRINLKK